MPGVISRILVSLVIILSGPAIYSLIVVYMEEGSSFGYNVTVLSATALTPIPLVIAWIGVWASLIRWNPRRVFLTFAVLSGAILIGVGLHFGYLIITPNTYSGDRTGVIFGAMFGSLAWFGLTPLVWKESRAERSARLKQLGGDDIPCPVCGYNLTGLHQARCPECGASYTLDQLYARLREPNQPLSGE